MARFRFPLRYRQLRFEQCEERRLLSVNYRPYGLDFSPYIAPGENPNTGGTGQITPAELSQRVATIAPVTRWIRTFGLEDDLLTTGQLIHAAGDKAAIGAWIGPNVQSNQDQLDRLVNQAIQGHVDLAIVGSETLQRGDVSKETLIGYINQVKQRLAAASVSIPVTTADTFNQLRDHPEVIDAVDVVFVNYYPFWAGVSVESAVATLGAWHQQMLALAGGKEVIVSETGWPSAGQQVGSAVPSPENAAYYFLNFDAWARAHNVNYFYFQAIDEAWKDEGGVGPHWGLFDASASLKAGMERVFNDDHPWYNLNLPADTDGDGSVSSIDLISTVDALNTLGGGFLPSFAPTPTHLVDVNRDNYLSSIDLLLVVASLNNAPALHSAEPSASAKVQNGLLLVADSTLSIGLAMLPFTNSGTPSPPAPLTTGAVIRDTPAVATSSTHLLDLASRQADSITEPSTWETIREKPVRDSEAVWPSLEPEVGEWVLERTSIRRPRLSGESDRPKPQNGP